MHSKGQAPFDLYFDFVQLQLFLSTGRCPVPVSHRHFLLGTDDETDCHFSAMAAAAVASDSKKRGEQLLFFQSILSSDLHLWSHVLDSN